MSTQSPGAHALLETARAYMHNQHSRKWASVIALWYSAALAGDPDHKILAMYIYESAGDKPIAPLYACWRDVGTRHLVSTPVVNLLLSHWPQPDKYPLHVDGVAHALLRWVPDLRRYFHTSIGGRGLLAHSHSDLRTEGWDPAGPHFSLRPQTVRGAHALLDVVEILDGAGWRIPAPNRISVLRDCRALSETATRGGQAEQEQGWELEARIARVWAAWGLVPQQVSEV